MFSKHKKKNFSFITVSADFILVQTDRTIHWDFSFRFCHHYKGTLTHRRYFLLQVAAANDIENKQT